MKTVTTRSAVTGRDAQKPAPKPMPSDDKPGGGKVGVEGEMMQNAGYSMQMPSGDKPKPRPPAPEQPGTPSPPPPSPGPHRPQDDRKPSVPRPEMPPDDRPRRGA